MQKNQGGWMNGFSTFAGIICERDICGVPREYKQDYQGALRGRQISVSIGKTIPTVVKS